jgi:signal transduction histidine kinase
LRIHAALRNIDLRFERANEPAFIRCDVGQIRQMLSNVLGNAIKFTADNTMVIILLRSHFRSENDHHETANNYRLQVFDRGPGNPSNISAKCTKGNKRRQ